MLIKSKFVYLFVFHFYHCQAELMEFKQKQEEETRTRALKNEQRRYDTKNAEYTWIEFPPGKGLKIAGTHALEDYCN